MNGISGRDNLALIYHDFFTNLTLIYHNPNEVMRLPGILLQKVKKVRDINLRQSGDVTNRREPYL